MSDPWEEVFGLLHGFAQASQDVSTIINAVNQVKGRLADSTPQDWQEAPMLAMQSFHPVTQDPFGGGIQWLGQLQSVALQHGNGWVPHQTVGIGGVDLTGVWGLPGVPNLCYLRQYGPYLNLVVGVGTLPLAFAEGLFDPLGCNFALVGRRADHGAFQASGQLMADWTLRGSTVEVDPRVGTPTQFPLLLQRLA